MCHRKTMCRRSGLLLDTDNWYHITTMADSLSVLSAPNLSIMVSVALIVSTAREINKNSSVLFLFFVATPNNHCFLSVDSGHTCLVFWSIRERLETFKKYEHIEIIATVLIWIFLYCASSYNKSPIYSELPTRASNESSQAQSIL